MNFPFMDTTFSSRLQHTQAYSDLGSMHVVFHVWFTVYASGLYFRKDHST